MFLPSTDSIVKVVDGSSPSDPNHRGCCPIVYGRASGNITKISLSLNTPQNAPEKEDLEQGHH